MAAYRSLRASWHHVIQMLIVIVLLSIVACQSHVISKTDDDKQAEPDVKILPRFRRDVEEDGNSTAGELYGTDGEDQMTEHLGFEMAHRDIFTYKFAPDTETGGATYIRWGKNKCLSNIDTELVYSGVAGGTHFTSTGGASDYLCLPHNPQWSHHNDAINNNGEVYGAEYETANFPFTIQANGPSTLQDHNVPCAVCRSTKRPSSIMIPARYDCYTGWTKEYSGYLMSGSKVNLGRYQYTCMDQDPDIINAGFRNENGALFYPVDAVCGSLPCPPYVNGRELTCVVCTK